MALFGIEPVISAPEYDTVVVNNCVAGVASVM